MSKFHPSKSGKKELNNSEFTSMLHKLLKLQLQGTLQRWPLLVQYITVFRIKSVQHTGMQPASIDQTQTPNTSFS
jgi:hypothetical protein